MFAYAAAQVRQMLEVTQRLGGQNYVLWGGREGYDTLLNTDLRREGEQLARFLHLVAEHKHKIGFEGTLLIEPKPMEPTKHQYDYDTATVHGFLVRNGLDGEYKVNIEANHATLAGHSFHHEVAYAVANGIWAASMPTAATRRTAGTPTSSPTRSRTWRCRSTRSCGPVASQPAASTSTPSCAGRARPQRPVPRAHRRLDTLARALLVAADLVERGELATLRDERYAGWDGALGGAIMDGSLDLAALEARVADGSIDPRRVSGGQERLENLVNQRIWAPKR